MNIYLEEFDEALDKAKQMTLRLNDSKMSDVAMQIIHAVELLADEVHRAANLERDNKFCDSND